MSTHPSANPLPSADVELAEQCDRAGKHTDAIKHLVAGTRKNDLEAMTRLGKRLLVGDRAPHLPNDGAGLIKDASTRGSGEAAAMLSVLFAVGGNVEHGLDSALQHLIVAAERGWSPAQSQLRVLAGQDPAHAGDEAAPAAAWRELAQQVDLAGWQTAPPATDLNDTPLIRSFQDFVSPNICRWLIEKSRGRLSPALVYEAIDKKTTVHQTRTNTATLFNLLETDLVCTLVQTRMCACLGQPFRHLEPMTVLHYAEGEQITNHFDFIDPKVPDYEQQIAEQGQRVVTFLIYLNDDYTGGETEFPRLGISHKGQRAQGLFFVNSLPDGSPDLRTMHAGRPPLQGEKWIVSQFVRDRPTF
jgi:hypothetical protein